MDMKRFFLYAIVIAALTLAGCGGGGGGGGTSLMVGDERATQDAINALEKSLADTRMALGLADNATTATILAAIMALEAEDPVFASLRTALGLAGDADRGAILAAVEGLDMDAMRDAGGLAAVRTALGLADAATTAAILAAIQGLGGTTSEDPALASLRTALGLADDADRAAILAAVQGLGPDLAAVRMELGLADDADRAAILAAITALRTTTSEDPVLASLRTALGLAGDADRGAILAAVEGLDMDAMRDAGGLAAVRTELGLADDADRAAILAAITALRTTTSEDPVLASLRVALGLADNADRGAILNAVLALAAEDTRTEDAIAAKKAPAIADPDGDEMLGENDADTPADDDINYPTRPSKLAANLFTVTAGGIETRAILSIGASGSEDRLGMPDAGIDDDDEFVMTAEGTRDGFARNRHDRTVDEVTTDEVTVFDNRDDPKDVEYGTFYSTDDAASRDAVTGIDGDGVLTLDVADIDGNHDLFSASAFPTGEDQTYTYADDNPDTMENDERRGGQDFNGRFNGVPGKFACTGTNCTARTDSMGRLDMLTGTWTFTPDDVDEDADPHKIEDAEYDADYLAFGFWLRGTTSRGETTYSIGTFATGSQPFAVGDTTAGIPALVGTATYSGPAAGMFVMKTDIDGDNMGPVATQAGKFVADATLTAKFGDATMTVDDFTIGGDVRNFVLTNYDGTRVGNDWSLKLNSAPFADRTYDAGTGAIDDITSHRNTFSGTTTGMEMGTAGRWAGMFYGPTVEDDATTITVDESETGFPTGVAGEFIGHFETGHAIGAFGAELDP